MRPLTNKRSTKLEYGFGDLGLISLSDEPTDEDLLRYDWLRHSVRATIDRAYAAAVEALERNRVVLDALALALFEAGYLDRDEIERVLSPFMFDHGPVDENSISSRTGPAALPPTEPASAGVTLSFPDNLETPS